MKIEIGRSKFPEFPMNMEEAYKFLIRRLDRELVKALGRAGHYDSADYDGRSNRIDKRIKKPSEPERICVAIDKDDLYRMNCIRCGDEFLTHRISGGSIWRRCIMCLSTAERAQKYGNP